MKNYLRNIALTGCLLCAACGTDDSRRTSTEVQRQSIPPRAAEFMVQGYQSLQVGDYAYGLASVDSAAYFAPQLADVPFLRGRILAEMSRLGEARAAFERVLELDSKYEGVHFNLGVLAFQAEEYEKALEHFRMEHRREQSAATLVQIGRTLEQLGRLDEASAAYEDAIDIDRNSAAAYARLSQLHEQADRPEEALETIKKAVEIDSTNLDYRYLYGYQLYRTDRWAESAEVLEAVVAAQPWHPGAHYNLGQALIRLGRGDEAERYLARADTLEEMQAHLDELRDQAETTPEDPMQWVRFGDALYETGRIEAASDAYRVAAALAPWSPEIHINLASLTLTAGDTSQAVSLYRHALDLDSTQVDAWYNLGVLYANAGNTEFARRAWTNALRHRPSDATIKASLASIE